jgi:S-adenosylmethionine decarboxylase
MFNIYDICYARSKSSQNDYLEYVDEEYNSTKLRSILEEVTRIIQASIINISSQDYDPRGASVTMLINDGHLKSGISTFRVDIDVATCGMISPLRALDFLIDSFDTDIVLMDYRVRGFTRDVSGRKIYMDHDITSIQDYISDEILSRYIAYDINIVSDNIFHTKMMLKNFRLEEYLFGQESEGLGSGTRSRLRTMLKKEIQEIFECRNIYEE